MLNSLALCFLCGHGVVIHKTTVKTCFLCGHGVVIHKTTVKTALQKVSN